MLIGTVKMSNLVELATHANNDNHFPDIASRRAITTKLCCSVAFYFN